MDNKEFDKKRKIDHKDDIRYSKRTKTIDNDIYNNIKLFLKNGAIAWDQECLKFKNNLLNFQDKDIKFRQSLLNTRRNAQVTFSQKWLETEEEVLNLELEFLKEKRLLLHQNRQLLKKKHSIETLNEEFVEAENKIIKLQQKCLDTYGFLQCKKII